MKKLTYVDKIILAADIQLEGENNSSVSVENIWNAIEPFIRLNQKVDAAMALANQLAPGWEDELQHIKD